MRIKINELSPLGASLLADSESLMDNIRSLSEDELKISGGTGYGYGKGKGKSKGSRSKVSRSKVSRSKGSRSKGHSGGYYYDYGYYYH